LEPLFNVLWGNAVCCTLTCSQSRHPFLNSTRRSSLAISNVHRYICSTNSAETLIHLLVMALHLTFSAPHPTTNLITVHQTLHHGPQRLAMSERFLIGATFNAGVIQATNTHPPAAYSPRVGSGTLNAQGTTWTSVRQPGPHNFTILRQTSIRIHPTSPWQHQ
jgi:hypothetical protein